MAFQPLGYSFEIVSSMQRDEAKAAIRASWTEWFDTTPRPRGWILGPFLCSWRSAFDRNGPMVVARIISDGGAVRVTGRAGSDLNGMAYMTALIVIIILITFLRGDSLGGRTLLVMTVVLMMFGLVLWLGHRDRKKADSLVANLRRALGSIERVSRDRPRVPFPADCSVPMRLQASEGDEAEPASPAQVHDALCRVAEDETGFVVLIIDDTHYMQTAWDRDGFTLEQRDGSEAKHFVAIRAAEPPDRPRTGSTLSLAEVEAAFAAYCAQTGTPPGIAWTPLYV